MQEDFQLVILNGLNCSPDFKLLHRKAYEHWREMWKSTFLELDGSSQVPSDNFSRQDDVIALFHQQKCVAMVCHRYVDLTLISNQEDSYFSTWPVELLAKLKTNVAIGNQISIHPNFRKLPSGVPTKDALLWISLKRLKEQNIEYVLGAVREDKGLDKLFVKYGARVLKSNVQQHNVQVALVSFKPKDINLNAAELSQILLEDLYGKRAEDPLIMRSVEPLIKAA